MNYSRQILKNELKRISLYGRVIESMATKSNLKGKTLKDAKLLWQEYQAKIENLKINIKKLK